MSKSKIQLHSEWLELVGNEFEQDYMQALRMFLREQKSLGKKIYPPSAKIFNALDSTPPKDVKAVILGQDPYHGPGQAHGLSFSVPMGVRPPPSLQNIFKEIHQDLDMPIPNHGCLQSWADQGVLLLNATLTVEHGKAGSHQNQGWEQFTDAVIKALNHSDDPIVFLLWGKYAQDKGKLIDSARHKVLSSPHPSPFSAHRGFLGNKHFSQANRFLIENGRDPINWSLM